MILTVVDCFQCQIFLHHLLQCLGNLYPTSALSYRFVAHVCIWFGYRCLDKASTVLPLWTVYRRLSLPYLILQVAPISPACSSGHLFRFVAAQVRKACRSCLPFSVYPRHKSCRQILMTPDVDLDEGIFADERIHDGLENVSGLFALAEIIVCLEYTSLVLILTACALLSCPGWEDSSTISSSKIVDTFRQFRA